MMPFYGTKRAQAGSLVVPGCGFAANASSKNLDAVKKSACSNFNDRWTERFMAEQSGGSSYLNGVEFDLPEAYTSVAGALPAVFSSLIIGYLWNFILSSSTMD